MSLDMNISLDHFTISDFDSLPKKLGLAFMNQTNRRIVLDKNEMENHGCFKQFKNLRTDEFILTKDDILFSLPNTIDQIPSKVELPISSSNNQHFLLRANDTIFYSHLYSQTSLSTKNNEKRLSWKELCYSDSSCENRLVKLLKFCIRLATEPAKYDNMNYAVFPNNHFIGNVCIGQEYQAEIPDLISLSSSERYADEPDREELLPKETLFAEKKAVFFDKHKKQPFAVKLKFNFCFDHSVLESSSIMENKLESIQKPDIDVNKHGGCDRFSLSNKRKNAPGEVEQLTWKYNRFMASSTTSCAKALTLSPSKIAKQSLTKPSDACSNQQVMKFKSDIRTFMVGLLKKPVPNNLVFTLPKNVRASNAASDSSTNQKSG